MVENSKSLNFSALLKKIFLLQFSTLLHILPLNPLVSRVLLLNLLVPRVLRLNPLVPKSASLDTWVK